MASKPDPEVIQNPEEHSSTQDDREKLLDEHLKEVQGNQTQDQDDGPDQPEDPSPAAEVLQSPKDFEKAQLLKTQGNEHFSKKDWDSALECYQKAVEYCPHSESDFLSKLYSNIAIVFMRKSDHKNVINFCNLSLDIDSSFAKPLVNRADAYYQTKQWEKALEDYKQLQKLGPDYANPAREEICQKEFDKEMEVKKDQVLGQLKDLGNSLLGKFGFSLDNFKMEKQEGGGYSVQFKQ